MRQILRALVLSTTFACAAGAQVLNFEGIDRTYPFAFGSAINGFYNGGTSAAGTTGVNYGIEFSPNAESICFNTPAASCSSASRGGQGDPGSQRSGLAMHSPSSSMFMNYAAGFANGFSLFYNAPRFEGGIQVWSGLSGTGTLLGSLVLRATPFQNCGTIQDIYCPLVAAGLTFSGIARSVVLTGASGNIVFDDVTFGNATAGEPPIGVVPEPSQYVLAVTGLLMLAGVRRARRNRAG